MFLDYDAGDIAADATFLVEVWVVDVRQRETPGTEGYPCEALTLLAEAICITRREQISMAGVIVRPGTS